MLHFEIYVNILIQFNTFEKDMNIYLGSIELFWDFNDIYNFCAIIVIVLRFFTYLLVLLTPDVDEFCCCCYYYYYYLVQYIQNFGFSFIILQ